MTVTVAITTYKRAWALQYSLASLTNQSVPPDEVLIILKAAPHDNSMDVISGFEGRLPIRVVMQEDGNMADAVNMAIQNARGDLLLFLDDDAVAEDKWIEKYMQMFRQHDDMGALSGPVYDAYIENNVLVKTEEFNRSIPTASTFYRRPLPEFQDYCEWVSVSGFMGAKQCDTRLMRATGFRGANMGFRVESVRDCPLSSLYRGSRVCFQYEQILAFCVRRSGFHVYRSLDPSIAPMVWHIHHGASLTTSRGFRRLAWTHYDRVMTFWRLRKLGAQVSFTAYAAATLVAMRKEPLQRLLGTIYGLIHGVFL